MRFILAMTTAVAVASGSAARADTVCEWMDFASKIETAPGSRRRSWSSAPRNMTAPRPRSRWRCSRRSMPSTGATKAMSGCRPPSPAIPGRRSRQRRLSRLAVLFPEPEDGAGRKSFDGAGSGRQCRGARSRRSHRQGRRGSRAEGRRGRPRRDADALSAADHARRVGGDPAPGVRASLCQPEALVHWASGHFSRLLPRQR